MKNYFKTTRHNDSCAPICRRLLLGVSLALVVLAGAAELSAADPLRLTLNPDRADAIYSAGATAKIVVQLWKGKEKVTDASMRFALSDFLSGPEKRIKNATGTVKSGDVVRVHFDKPGFVRCSVSYAVEGGKPVSKAIGIGFSPEKIQASLPVPDDFDEFWKTQKDSLAKVSMQPVLTPVKQADDTINCFDLQVACAGGAPVSGYLAFPKNAAPKSLPAILWVHGAGVRSSSLRDAAQGASRGMLSLDINAHGIPNGKPGTFYRNLSSGKLRNYRHAGRDSRDTIYFRGMFLRLVRAIDYLTSRPEWDGKTLVVIGHSQGGGQALVAGGLDSRVTMIASGVPAICDHTGHAAGRVNGWPKIVPVDANGKHNQQVSQAARYVDAVNFAARCRAEAIVSVGFIDAVCPPSSCYAAYNSLRGKKQIVTRPEMGHAAPQDIREAFMKAVAAHIARK